MKSSKDFKKSTKSIRRTPRKKLKRRNLMRAIQLLRKNLILMVIKMKKKTMPIHQTFLNLKNSRSSEDMEERAMKTMEESSRMKTKK